MKKPFSIQRRKIIYSGRIVQLEILELSGPDGRPIKRELIRHRGAAVVIPVLKGERFVLVSQHRIAINSWLLEFPAGTLEPNEPPRACAYRETIEETGYRPRKLVKLADFYPAPGVSTERMHLFLATDLVPAEGKLDDDEFLEVRIFARRALERKIQSGEIKDGKTLIGFYYYLEHLKSARPCAVRGVETARLDFHAKSG